VARREQRVDHSLDAAWLRRPDRTRTSAPHRRVAIDRLRAGILRVGLVPPPADVRRHLPRRRRGRGIHVQGAARARLLWPGLPRVARVLSSMALTQLSRHVDPGRLRCNPLPSDLALARLCALARSFPGMVVCKQFRALSWLEPAGPEIRSRAISRHP